MNLAIYGFPHCATCKASEMFMLPSRHGIVVLESIHLAMLPSGRHCHNYVMNSTNGQRPALVLIDDCTQMIIPHDYIYEWDPLVESS